MHVYEVRCFDVNTNEELHGVRVTILRFMQGRLHRNIRRCIK